MLNYSHLVRMTDNQGILQFSHLGSPDPGSGYTLDDNARALMIALGMDNGHDLALVYARNLHQAQMPDGSWSNLLLKDCYEDSFDSEDSIGRGLIACSLGCQSNWPEVSRLCAGMLRKNLGLINSFQSPRGMAYAILALTKAHPGTRTKSLLLKLCHRLISLYQRNQQKNWHWFENYLTYCNGVLPHALLAAYQITGDKKTLKIAHESLKFLNGILFQHGYLNIIGNQGWYQKGGKIPLYDQQPVDAASIAYACNEAYKVLGLAEYRDLAYLSCLWYHGRNIKGISMIDPQTEGCYDALTPTGVNLNQGAEALISLLASEMLRADTLLANDMSNSSV